MTAWADDETSPWEEMEFDRYGLHAKLKVKTIRALYYKAGKDRLLTIVLVRDTTGGRPDQMFYCTRTDWDARAILGHYAGRWSVEVCQADSIPRYGLYPSTGPAHSERGGAAAPGPLVPGAPSRHRRAAAMRSDSERPVPPRTPAA
jgi:hypothetical protein